MSGTINKGRKLFVCETPQPDDLTQVEFEALTWVEVANVVSIGETGTSQNMVGQDYHGTTVTQKQKGIANAGDPTVELGYTPADLGYIALLAMAAPNNNFSYATKMEMNDNPDDDTTNTIKYNRGPISGPTHTNGGVEDFDNRIFTFANNQLQIEVAPEAIV